MEQPAHRPQRTPLVSPGGIDHHVADLTATVSADVTLAALQQELAARDQWLPIDGDPQLSLGQLVETNSTGPLRLGFGAWRDLLLGAQFTTAPGKFITAGGRTMKNVAGYDLTKFMVGQHGLFGRVATITTRTYKRPELALLAQLPWSPPAFAPMLITESRPHWALVNEGKLYCGYLGDERTIRFYESALRQRGAIELAQQSLDADIAFRSNKWLTGRAPVIFRASVPPSRVAELIASVEDPTCSADPAFGIVVGSCATAAEAEVIDRRAEELGGTVVHNDLARIKSYFGAKPPESNLLQRLQSAFDQT